MKWTYDHNVIFVRQILAQARWVYTTETREVWSIIADSLNAMENPSLKSLRGNLEIGIHTWKNTIRPKLDMKSN